MANTMTTYLKSQNLNEENYVKFSELFKTENENSSYVDIIEHFNKLFDEKFNNSDNVIDRNFMDQNIGSKWITVEFGDDGYSSEVDVIIESAWSVPTEYLQKVRDVLTEWNEDITLSGTYEDEGYSPIGAFVYAFDYDDIEDPVNRLIRITQICKDISNWNKDKKIKFINDSKEITEHNKNLFLSIYENPRDGFWNQWRTND